MTLRTTPARPPRAARATAGPPEILVLVCAGVVLASLDLFIVNVALPRIARDLGAANLSELSWVLNGYAIVYASLLVFFGRLADRYRRDRAFLLGVAVFTAASAACAASTSVPMLVAFRLVQAAGAALLTPTSLGLVLASFEPARRQGAVRAWTAVGGLAAAIGPVVGGLLVAASWRWVFLVNVPIGIVALVVGWRRLPEVPGHAIERPDPLGVVLVTAGVGLLTFGLVKGPGWGWGSARTGLVLGAAVTLLALFVLHCLRSRAPLVHPELFRSRQFTGASVVAIFFSTAFAAMLLSIVLWEQGVWGWSPLRAGLAIAPGPLMVPLASFLVAGRLIRRFGPALVMSLGSLVFGAGVAWWALAATVDSRLRRGGARGDDPHRGGGGPDAAHDDEHRGGVAARPRLRHRLRGHQHDPADRPRPRRSGPGGRARHPRRPGRRAAGRLPARVVGNHRHRSRRDHSRPGPAAPGPARGGGCLRTGQHPELLRIVQ